MGQKERLSKQAESDLHRGWKVNGPERGWAARIEMGFIWITELGGVILAPSRHLSSRLSLFRLALCSISPSFHSQCHSLHPPFPSFHRPQMPLPEKNTPDSMTLYHDIGYGPLRPGSQNSRKFRVPVVYSKSLSDLYANYYSSSSSLVT